MSMLDKLLLKGKSDNGDGGCGGDGYGRVGERGFTIVEVMIVIGIGALLAVLVLVAAGQLQQSGRNSTRVNDIGAIEGAIAQYTVNNNGNLPTKGPIGSPADGQSLQEALDGLKLGFYNGAIDTGATDNTASKNKISFVTTTATSQTLPDQDTMYIVAGYECKNDIDTTAPKPKAKIAWHADHVAETPSTGKNLLKPASSRVYSTVYAVEGDTTLKCRDNT